DDHVGPAVAGKLVAAQAVAVGPEDDEGVTVPGIQMQACGDLLLPRRVHPGIRVIQQSAVPVDQQSGTQVDSRAVGCGGHVDVHVPAMADVGYLVDDVVARAVDGAGVDGIGRPVVAANGQATL